MDDATAIALDLPYSPAEVQQLLDDQCPPALARRLLDCAAAWGLGFQWARETWALMSKAIASASAVERHR